MDVQPENIKEISSKFAEAISKFDQDWFNDETNMEKSDRQKLKDILADDKTQVEKLVNEFKRLFAVVSVARNLKKDLQNQLTSVSLANDIVAGEVLKQKATVESQIIKFNSIVDETTHLKDEVTRVNEEKAKLNEETNKLNVFIDHVKRVLSRDDLEQVPTYLDDALHSYLSQALSIPTI